MSGFDYLEWAFEDLFGLWSPEEQSFSPSFLHQPDVESLYRHSAWIPRILNRGFETMPFFTEQFHTVCPWSGTGIFWCVLRMLAASRLCTDSSVGAIYFLDQDFWFVSVRARCTIPGNISSR